MTDTQEMTPDMFEAIFDSIPLPIFVVDRDVRIHAYNVAATPLLAAEGSAILRRRGGEVLNCLHSHDVPEGCGRAPFCKDCVIRNSVNLALKGDKVVRQRHKLELVREGHIQKVYALITASSILFQGNHFVLLVIEDINEIVELRKIIPICAKCKKVRSDKDYWMMVESYFRQHLDVDFSHGLCPDCYQEEIDALEKTIKAKQSSGGDRQ